MTEMNSGNEGMRKITAAAHESEILTVPEVAQALRCSKAHVHNLINGKVSGVLPLPTIHLGRRRLIRRKSLDGWAQDHERTFHSDILLSSPEVDAVDA
jgi:excisionase family DNA binding protein